MTRIIWALTILFAACSGDSAPSSVHADGGGPLEFAPGRKITTTFDASAPTEVLIGGLVMSNAGDRPVEIGRFEIPAEGSCTPMPAPYREPFDQAMTGTAVGSPASVGARPMSDDNAVPAGEAMAVVFLVDGTACEAGDTAGYGPVSVGYG